MHFIYDNQTENEKHNFKGDRKEVEGKCSKQHQTHTAYTTQTQP